MTASVTSEERFFWYCPDCKYKSASNWPTAEVAQQAADAHNNIAHVHSVGEHQEVPC